MTATRKYSREGSSKKGNIYVGNPPMADHVRTSEGLLAGESGRYENAGGHSIVA